MRRSLPWARAALVGRAGADSACSSEHEIQRIRETYRCYDNDPSVRARRNPSNAGARAIGTELESALRGAIAGLSFPEGGRVCDVGCGSGRMLALIGETLSPCRPRLYGMDILPDRIEVARRQVPDAKLWVQSGEMLPFPDNSVQLLVVATVFSSILESGLAERIAAEMWRVKATGGTIIGYDFRYPNPRNPNTRRMGLRHWHQLFPDALIEARSIILIPPIARRLHRFTDTLYPKLGGISALRAHYLVKISSPIAGQGDIRTKERGPSETGSQL